MKTFFFQVSRVLNFFYMLVFIMVAIGCNSTGNHDNEQSQNTLAPDTLGASTSDMKLNSLLRLSDTAPQDTALAQLYIDIGKEYYYQHNDFQKAKEYYRKANELSEKLNWSNGRYQFATRYANVLNYEGLADSSIVIFEQTLDLAKKEMNKSQIAYISANLGLCYYNKNWFETALKYFHEAVQMLEKLNDEYSLAHLYDLMGLLYGSMSMYSENLKYAEKAVEIFSNKPDTLQRASALCNYAVALSYQNELDKAESCLMEAFRICTLHNNMAHLIQIYGNLAYISMKKFDLDKAEMYYRKEIEIVGNNNVENLSISHFGLAGIELYRGNFLQSKVWAEEALNAAKQYNLQEVELECYNLYSCMASARHDFRNYVSYKEKADSVKNMMVSEKTRMYAKEMEAKYETEKKELKIISLEEQHHFFILLSISTGMVLVLGLAALFFMWRFTVQKRRLAEQQIKQLQQEKQLIATQAVLDGETQERARLARDLHDGLGSMLTGVKLNLELLKNSVVLNPDEVKYFDNAMSILGNSTLEMRRIAHHLMPDALSRYGLKAALTDFCTDFPIIEFVWFGSVERLDDHQLEVMIYRIIHELVNNALKHSGATKIGMNVMHDADYIAFTVYDNGCGFDKEQQTKGMGLQNIRERVSACNGRLDINTNVDKGTEVNVELRIEN